MQLDKKGFVLTGGGVGAAPLAEKVMPVIMATMMIVAAFDSEVRDSRWRRAVRVVMA